MQGEQGGTMYSRSLSCRSDQTRCFERLPVILTGGLLNVIGKSTAIKQVTDLQPIVANGKNSVKGYVIYIDHLETLSLIIQNFWNYQR
jgi:hypothetical protein